MEAFLDELDEMDREHPPGSETLLQKVSDARPARFEAATGAYPDTDARFEAATDAYPDTDAQFEGASDAYPDTDAQFERGREDGTSGGWDDEDGPTCGAGSETWGGDVTLATDEVAASAVPRAQPKATDACHVTAASTSSEAPSRWKPPQWARAAQWHRPRLELLERGVSVRSMEMAELASVVIGRHGGLSDVVLEEPSVSRAHAALVNSSAATYLTDLGSLHGTYYDEKGRTHPEPQLGARLEPDAEPTQLREGATFRLGSSCAVFRVSGLEPEQAGKWQPPRWAEEPTRRCILEFRTNEHFQNPYLAHRGESESGCDEEIDLAGRRCMVIGRNQHACEVVLRHESISMQHAAIVHAEKKSYVIDVHSTSGTIVDGHALPPGTPVELNDGAVLRLGDCDATYTYRLRGPSGRVDLSGASKRRRKL